jgi:hypothetical protein
MLLHPLQVDTRWAPEIHKFMPMLNDNTGFEYFTLDFPWSPYQGHFLVGHSSIQSGCLCN